MTGSDDFAWDFADAPLHAGMPTVEIRRHSNTSSWDGDTGLYDHLLALLEGPAWHRDAACKGMDPAVFFPGSGEDTGNARQVCASCPVRAECAEAGMREVHGIWGGMSGRERRERRNGPRCGTPAGYRWHGYVGEEACDQCRAAEAARKRKGMVA